MLYKIERVIYDILMLVKSEGYIVMITAVLVKNDYSKHCVRAELFGHVLTVKMGECRHFGHSLSLASRLYSKKNWK